MSPHQTASSVFSSQTINLSFGDLPVNSPVSMASAPLSASTPIPFKMVSSTNSAGDKFQNALATFPKPNSSKLAVSGLIPNSFIYFSFCFRITNLSHLIPPSFSFYAELSTELMNC